MTKLLIVLLISLCLAYCSQKNILVFEFGEKTNNRIKRVDFPLILLLIVLCLFCGLRTDYNDTATYNAIYNNSMTVSEYMDSSPKLMGNPLFYIIQGFFRHDLNISCYMFTMLVAIFCNTSFILFIHKHCDNFIFGILLYFCIGLYVDTFAAMKQCLALAVLTYSINALINKRYLLFYLIVAIAILIHSYAVFFVILPLFVNKPWTIITYITIFGFVFALLTFESAITGFLSVAEEAGKSIADEELFDNVGINPLRLAVFAVPPILSFFFQEHLEEIYDTKNSILMNMSILSFLVMSLGIFTAANLFGRSAMYFEIGTVILLPKIISTIFDKASSKAVSIIIALLYIGFFLYDNMDFSTYYRAMTLEQFFKTAL